MTALVPEGRLLHLLGGEIDPNPSGVDQLVWAVAVVPAAEDGLVHLTGHTCGANPDCGGHWCFEALVTAAAIRDNLAGAR